MSYGELSNTQETMVLPMLQMKNIRGKPYILVSSKGIVNGLSNIPNDGADFGPDTTKGATAPGQYGGTYTETSGILDAVNYIYGIGGGTIQLIGENFNVTNTPVEDPNNSGTYYQIGIPFNAITNKFIQINIIGNSKQTTYAGPNSAPSTTRVPGGTTIVSKSTSTNTFYLFYVLAGNVRGNQNNVGIYLDGVNFQVPAVTNANAVGLQWAIGANGGTILLWTDAIYGTTSTVTNSGGIGLNIANTFNTESSSSGGGYGNWYYWGFISAQGFNRAILISVHTHIGFLAVYYSKSAISIASGVNASGQLSYGNLISFADIQQSAIVIDCINGSALRIDTLNLGDITTTSGYFYTSTYFIQNTVAQSLLSIGSLMVEDLPLPPNNISQPVYGNIKYVSPSLLSPTISTNPPVSGTAYQNTNPYDIYISVPITFPTTASTAMSAYLRVGTSSTAGANPIMDQFSEPATLATASGRIWSLKAKVPAGQYFEVDVVNASIGTAVVAAA